MPTATPRSLRTAIDAGSFDSVYVLFGDEDFIKEEVLRLLIARAVNVAMRDFNVDIRRGPELDAVGLRGLLEQLPMMAERRVIVLRVARRSERTYKRLPR